MAPDTDIVRQLRDPYAVIHDEDQRRLYADAAERIEALEGALRSVRDDISIFSTWKPEPTLAYQRDCVQPSVRQALRLIDSALGKDSQ